MNSINFNKLNTRLAASFLAMGIMVILLVTFTLAQINNLRDKATAISSELQPANIWMQHLNGEIKNSNSELLAFLISDNADHKVGRKNIWGLKIHSALDSLSYYAELIDSEEIFFLVSDIKLLATELQLKQDDLEGQSFFAEEPEEIDFYYYPEIDDEGKIEVNDEFISWVSMNTQSGGEQDPRLQQFYADIISSTNKIQEKSDLLSEQIEAQIVSMRESAFAGVRSFQIIEVLVIALVLGAGFFLFLFLRTHVNEAIQSIQKQLVILSEGNIPVNIPNRKDEMKQLIEEIEVLSTNLKAVKLFALEVGKGQFDNDITVFNNQGEIGSSLAEMRESLKKVAEEDKLRYWANQGYAQFGDILRRNVDSLKTLSDQLIGQLVKYLNASQGGIFILEEEGDDKFLEMISCYAYERHKYLEKRIQIGEGLVGQCFQEEEVIYLKELPDRYVKISSGLGNAKPRNLILVPLKFNDVIYGVIEIASFNEFLPHEQEFLHRVAESIASTISSVKVNENTKQLLEESQMLTEQMRAQEEEMRQNMEELEATQEEIHRKQNETAKVEKQFRELSENVPGVLFQMEMENEENFRITYISAASKSILGVSPEDAKSAKKLSGLFKLDKSNSEKFQSQLFESSMTNKEFHWSDRVHTRGGEAKILEITAKPGKNNQGEIMWNGFILDVTSEHEKFQATAEALAKAQQELAAMKESPASSTPSESPSSKASESQEELLKKLKANEEKLRASFKKKK